MVTGITVEKSICLFRKSSVNALIISSSFAAHDYFLVICDPSYIEKHTVIP
jgi:hypothetical protein